MSVLIFLLILVVLVIVHELGHFVVAKLFGVKVEEFGVGYPPRAFTFGRWGGTEYTLNWIPFGGFVRLLGEDSATAVVGTEKKRAFIYSTWWKKALILIAGVVCNVILAFVLFTLAASYGAPVAIDETSPLKDMARLIITEVYEGTPAADAGFVEGDIIVATKTKSDTLADVTPSGFSTFTGNHGGVEMFVTVKHKDETEKVISVIPAQGILEGKISTPAVGVSLGFVLQDEAPLIDVVPIGLRETKEWLGEVSLGLWNLFTGIFTGTSQISDVSGPVGIAVHVGEWYKLGIAHLLYFVAIISINLAVINMIPIPALDGGRLFFVLIEAVIRRRIPDVVGSSLNMIGFLALITLMIVVTYNDVIRLVQG